MSKKFVLVLVNIRSAYNVGAIARSAVAFGVDQIITTGITPHPHRPGDTRLPHIAAKANTMIAKTALGTADKLQWQHIQQPLTAVTTLKTQGYRLYALEQATDSVPINKFKPQWPAALLLGPEVAGLDRTLLQAADQIVEIPLRLANQSLNVSVAAGIALFALTRP
ncbi:TrmH family RNA methyltransferase [Candidatus Microgenomates bacterium]|nr:TrmH family RNA methyltransferase [Candidatus Microgenomates bacterium]